MAKHKPYRIVIYAFARGLGAILSLLPRSWILALARGMGSLAFDGKFDAPVLGAVFRAVVGRDGLA